MRWLCALVLALSACGDDTQPSADGPSSIDAIDAPQMGDGAIAGNVWEWTADYYDPSYYSTSPAQDPQGPLSGVYRVARGGSYATAADTLRCSNRVTGAPSLPYDDFGIRCAR